MFKICPDGCMNDNCKECYGPDEYIGLDKYIKHHKDIPYIDNDGIDKLMTLEQKEKFREWIFGQTMMVVDGKSMYFPWDVERFLLGMPIID